MKRCGQVDPTERCVRRPGHRGDHESPAQREVRRLRWLVRASAGKLEAVAASLAAHGTVPKVDDLRGWVKYLRAMDKRAAKERRRARP